jgi:TonB family protein
MVRELFALLLVAALVFAEGVNAQSPRFTPADPAKQARAEQDYLAKVASKVLNYRFTANAQPTKNVIEVQIVIARSGELLDSKIVHSSGASVLDQGVLDAVRKSSPYARLPPEIPGMNAIFKLPVLVSADGR